MPENPIQQLITDAVARGVNVTIVTNEYPEVKLTLPWVFKETNMDATGRYRAAGYDLIVQDQDGDGSWWELRRGKDVLAKGESWDHRPYYHFDACLVAAEAALRTEVKRRKAELNKESTS